MKEKKFIILISFLIIVFLCSIAQADEGRVDNRDDDILYFIDQSRDFFEMKMGAANLINDENGSYYENVYRDYKINYWVAADDFTINRISIIKANNYQDDIYPRRFMGIGFDMTMEEAEESVYNTPEGDNGKYDLRVEFATDENNIVKQIDVISNKSLEKKVVSEDFYLKYLGTSIIENWEYLNELSGNNSLHKDEEHREYIYRTVNGSDKWDKIYKYNSDNEITSLLLVGMTEEYKANVPELLGVQANMSISEADTALTSHDQVMIMGVEMPTEDNDLITYGYSIQYQGTKLYNVRINASSEDERVKSIEVINYDGIKDDQGVKNISLDMGFESVLYTIAEEAEDETGIDIVTGVPYRKLKYPGLEVYRNDLYLKSIRITDSRFGVFEDISIGDPASEALAYANSKYERVSFEDEMGGRVTALNCFDRGDGTYLYIDFGYGILFYDKGIEADDKVKEIVLTNSIGN
ncbi:MAG: hypothetical protein ACOCQO_02185 [Halanaerobiaceae bacterium]